LLISKNVKYKLTVATDPPSKPSLKFIISTMQLNPETPLSEPQAIAHIKVIARDLFPFDSTPTNSYNFGSHARNFYKTALFEPATDPSQRSAQKGRDGELGKKARRRPIFERKNIWENKLAKPRKEEEVVPLIDRINKR
jgi:hypothetical protein